MGDSIKAAGEMKSFQTGSRRGSSKGKGRFDLIPPEVEHELALHYEQGAEVYGDRNWQKGQPIGRYIDSLKRHLNQWMRGHRDEPHLRSVVWNAMGLLWTVGRILEGNLPRSLDDAGYLEPDMPDEPVADSEAEEAAQPAPAPVEEPAVTDARAILRVHGPMRLDDYYKRMEAHGWNSRSAFFARMKLETQTELVPGSSPEVDNYIVKLPEDFKS